MESILFNDQEMKKIFNPVSMEIITIVDAEPGINANDIQKRTERQYAYLIKTVKSLKKQNILRTEKKNRSKELYLTDKGSEIADELLKAINVVNSK